MASQEIAPVSSNDSDAEKTKAYFWPKAASVIAEWAFLAVLVFCIAQCMCNGCVL
jgi:hypothetical protein